MEYRKIIEFGKSSYVVSLPKDWLTEKKLGKGDVVYVSRDGNNLTFYPVDNKNAQNRKKVSIDVSNMTKDEIRLQLVSKYIRNFNEITLTADNLKSKAKDIRAIIHDIMALEVVEENASRIVTKDFLNMEDISPIDMIRKMDNITREMIADSKDSFGDDQYANIAERDTDVNRLSYLVFRTLRYFQKNPHVARKQGFEHHNYHVTWVAAVKIEGIADDAKRIAKLVRRLKFSKTDQEQFIRLYSLVEKYYLDGMDAFYNKDCEKAFKLVTQRKRLVKQCRDFYRENWNYEWVPIILEKLRSIISNTKSLMTYVCDMEECNDATS
jgi:phosphate uptake regulator